MVKGRRPKHFLQGRWKKIVLVSDKLHRHLLKTESAKPTDLESMVTSFCRQFLLPVDKR
jgi:hypothetical protein